MNLKYVITLKLHIIVYLLILKKICREQKVNYNLKLLQMREILKIIQNYRRKDINRIQLSKIIVDKKFQIIIKRINLKLIKW
jgi:hypothetical protein